MTLMWHGETAAHDRVFPLAIEGGDIVVTSKPTWGRLVKVTPSTAERRAMRGASRRPTGYTPHPDRERKLNGAAALARFAVSAEDLLPAQRKYVLSLALWFATEADGKYRLRYRSVQARQLKGEDRRLLRHDHVVTRKQLIEAMIRNPAQTEEIIRGAFACVVTDEEHKRLTALGGTYEGWDRYIAAGIDVFDEQEGVPLIDGGQFVGKAQESS